MKGRKNFWMILIQTLLGTFITCVVMQVSGVLTPFWFVTSIIVSFLASLL